jgi:hypothetical protein
MARMETLFPLPETPSPRLQWIAANQVKTYFASESDDGPWWAWCGERTAEQLYRGSKLEENFVQADTEEDAIVAHAKRRGIPLWNEPQKLLKDFNQVYGGKV